MIYVVLGMHKSGTTLVSQILHHSGINMGEFDESVGYDKGNQYEREEPWRLNDAILGSEGLLSIDIAAPVRLEMTGDQRRQMRAIIEKCNQSYVDWGFKDPRTTLTYPLWAQELPPHKIIAIYRPVDQLWRRYRPKLHRRYRDLGMARKLVERWTEHNDSIVQILRETPYEYVLFEYVDLMRSEDEFERLQAFTARELVDKRRQDLFRRREMARSLPLEVAKWTVKRERGLDVEDILEQLDSLRQQAVYV